MGSGFGAAPTQPAVATMPTPTYALTTIEFENTASL
jgi:hypothetical protein